VLLDFQGNLKSGLHDALAGVAVRIGFARAYAKEMNHWFTNVRVEPPALQQNRVEKNLALLSPLGVDVSLARYRLPDTSESARRVAEYLSSIGVRAKGFVLIHPGTSDYGAQKRWELDRFAKLADAIEHELALRVLVAWGPGERAMADEIAAGSRAIVAMETRSLLDLAELIRAARVFVGADSGPLHLASAVGAPSVALFGPKDPAVYGPYNPRSRVVHRPSANGMGSMDSITVDDALGAVCALA
jgi:ADP-heptose:LPS heptosyltransferase